MDVERVPAALRERLGADAAAGLSQLLDAERATWVADVSDVSADRFERRLTEEVSAVRIDMAQEFAAVRQEMAQGFAAVRQEMAQGVAAVRQEMARGFSALRRELAETRVDLLKWCFVFWIGQVLAIAGILAVVLRR